MKQEQSTKDFVEEKEYGGDQEVIDHSREHLVQDKEAWTYQKKGGPPEWNTKRSPVNYKKWTCPLSVQVDLP